MNHKVRGRLGNGKLLSPFSWKLEKLPSKPVHPLRCLTKFFYLFLPDGAVKFDVEFCCGSTMKGQCTDLDQLAKMVGAYEIEHRSFDQGTALCYCPPVVMERRRLLAMRRTLGAAPVETPEERQYWRNKCKAYGFTL